jgi:hypothetical protein
MNLLLKLFQDRLVAMSLQIQSKLKSGDSSSGGNSVVQIIDLATEEMADDAVTDKSHPSASAKFISGHLSSRRR